MLTYFPYFNHSKRTAKGNLCGREIRHNKLAGKSELMTNVCCAFTRGVPDYVKEIGRAHV